MVNVSLKNIGSVKVIPGTRGCKLSVKQVPRDLQEGALIDCETSKVILQNYDFVEQSNKEYNEVYGAADEPYCIEPGCEYHERLGIVVPRQYFYIIDVIFWAPNDKDVIGEQSYIYVK